MTTAIRGRTTVTDVLDWAVSDQDLEAAADENALSYTYQTSVYNSCCS